MVRWSVLALMMAASAASAAPQGVRLSFTGDTATTMSITWNTPGAAGTEVRYGTAPGALATSVSGTSFAATAGLGHVHEVTLTGLQPGTTYRYTAGSTDDGFSQEFELRTGPAPDATCGQFTFAVLGDNRPDPTFGGGENWPQILGQAWAHAPSFVINGGDLVVSGDRIDQWNAYLAAAAPVSANLPMMPAIGNHDTGPGQGDGANYNQLFALPRSTGQNGSGTEDYYSFLYGNAIFVFLSTETFKDGAIPFQRQADWLDEVLTANPRRWRFVTYHKPSYTKEAVPSISHSGNEEQQNAAFVPVIDKHHVDVVFTSHNHWYERFHPSACSVQGQPGAAAPCSVGDGNYGAGSVYVVTGGAGAFTIPSFLCGSMAGRATCSGDHHYVLATINHEQLVLETYAAYPQTSQVIDTITISKSAGACALVADGGVDGAPDAPTLDAGRDSAEAALQGDAAPADRADGPATEAGAAAQPATGCSCRASSSESSGLPLLSLALLVVWRRRRS